LVSKHTVSEGLALLLAFSLMLPAIGAEASQKEPLPKELEEGYASFRKVAMNEMGDFLDMRSYSLDNITMLMKEMTYHDGGLLNSSNSEIRMRYGMSITNSTKIAAEYLTRNILEPLKREKAVTLETGETIKAEELTRERLLELLFYYVRDNIKMAGPNDVPENERWMSGIPGLKFYAAADKIVQFPTETYFLGRGGICYDKALLLGTLLEMEGYDVAYGYYASWVLNIGPRSIRLPGYHSYVVVKDEGWGIGNWTIQDSRDMNGKDMSGRWIVLDPLYSPSYAPNMQMVGEHRPVKFAEVPPWAEILIKDQKGMVLPSELVFNL